MDEAQPGLPGIPEPETPTMIARVSALAIKTVWAFAAKKDIRIYLTGVNIRPIDGGVMLIATDGHRFVVMRDPNGYAERELVVDVHKDALKHAGDPQNTLDVMSSGECRILDEHANALFIQPGYALIESNPYPRMENVVNFVGYVEGISGAINPAYIADALDISDQFGAVRFFTRDADSPLLFVYSGLVDLECFGGIMKMRDAFESLPTWFPKRGEPTTLAEL